jgi:hypothetical protein
MGVYNIPSESMPKESIVQYLLRVLKENATNNALEGENLRKAIGTIMREKGLHYGLVRYWIKESLEKGGLVRVETQGKDIVKIILI